MKKKCLFSLMLACLLMLSGCVGFLPDRLTSTTDAELEGLHSPVAGAENADAYQAELYFRFGDEPFLASESRLLTVRKDESLEKAIVTALLSGPSAAAADLRRLFSDDVTVESTLAQGTLLFVTLSENVTEPLGDEPRAWQEDAYWRHEVPLRRKLAMQSLATTLIENCGYETVQILLHKRADTTGSMRLPMSYYAAGQEGLAPVLRWDDSVLLTPACTARTVLESYQQKDWDRLYRFVAVGPGASRPNQTNAGMMMDQWLTLKAYTLGETSVSLNGEQAILSCSATLARSMGDTQTLSAHPLRLVRENGIWKISWSELEGLLNRW